MTDRKGVGKGSDSSVSHALDFKGIGRRPSGFWG